MNFDDDIVEQMLDRGYIEEAGFNNLGEPLYRLTEKFYEENEELMEQIKLAESDILSSLWFKNFIDIKMNEKGQSYIYLTDKSDEWYSSDELTRDEKSMMYLLYTTGYYDDPIEGPGY